jgi:Zn-dependent alcohol dehydrogenase
MLPARNPDVDDTDQRATQPPAHFTGAQIFRIAVAASARLAGAAEIVATDLFDEALAIVSRMGATEVVNVSANESRLAAYINSARTRL